MVINFITMISLVWQSLESKYGLCAVSGLNTVHMSCSVVMCIHIGCHFDAKAQAKLVQDLL